MQARRLSTHRGQVAAMLVLMIVFALLGCSDNTDNVTPQDVEGRTFFFDSSFIDVDLDGLVTCVEYGASSATDENRLPFTLKFQDAVNATSCPEGQTVRCTDDAITAIATFSGSAIVNSIQHNIETILDEGGNMVDSIVIFEVEFAVGEIIEFEVEVDDDDDKPLELTFTNDNGNQILFEFETGETCADATPLRE